MYFDFGDGHPQAERLPQALSTREEVLVAIIVHLLVVIAVLVTPRLPFFKARAAAAEVARQAAIQRQQAERPQPFMFVQPRADIEALRPPPQAPASDINREARTRERAPNPSNRQPFSRGNTSEYIEPTPPSREARAAGPPGPPAPPSPAAPQPSPDETARRDTPGQQDAFQLPERQSSPQVLAREGGGARPAQSGSLGEALKNLQRYTERAGFDNPQGGNAGLGPSIQFDTKGVEFGPWIRRFIAQIKRNWFVPYAAMSLRGHSVITFNVHKDGSITEIAVIAPSDVDAFNNAAFNALAASNPTQPLPPEYPSDKAFFTVTFYYNESPPAP